MTHFFRTVAAKRVPIDKKERTTFYWYIPKAFDNLRKVINGLKVIDTCGLNMVSIKHKTEFLVF